MLVRSRREVLMDGLFRRESSSENSFCVIETHALRRSSVSRLCDGRTIRQRVRQAFQGGNTFATYPQFSYRICNFAVSGITWCLPALSCVTAPAADKQSRYAMTISRTCVCFFLLARFPFRLGDRCRYPAQVECSHQPFCQFRLHS